MHIRAPARYSFRLIPTYPLLGIEGQTVAQQGFDAVAVGVRPLSKSQTATPIVRRWSCAAPGGEVDAATRVSVGPTSRYVVP